MERQNQILIPYVFLDRCQKPRFVSVIVSIRDLSYRQDCEILKALTSDGNHSLDSNSPPKRRINKNCAKTVVCIHQG